MCLHVTASRPTLYSWLHGKSRGRQRRREANGECSYMACVLKCYVPSHSSMFKWSLMVIWTHSWGVLSTQYAEELGKCMGRIVPSETVDKFNYEGLCKALEENDNSRVTQSRVLKGLNLVGQSLILQNGCTGFFQMILKNDNPDTAVHALSYSWCGDFIRSAFSSGDLGVLRVYLNELAYEESISTGDI